MKKVELEKLCKEYESRIKTLEDRVYDQRIADEKTRGFISKLFGHNDYYTLNKRETLSWEEIYFHLGKLTESKNQLDLADIYKLVAIAKEPEILAKLQEIENAKRF